MLDEPANGVNRFKIGRGTCRGPEMPTVAFNTPTYATTFLFNWTRQNTRASPPAVLSFSFFEDQCDPHLCPTTTAMEDLCDPHQLPNVLVLVYDEADLGVVEYWMYNKQLVPCLELNRVSKFALNYMHISFSSVARGQRKSSSYAWTFVSKKKQKKNLCKSRVLFKQSGFIFYKCTLSACWNSLL